MPKESKLDAIRMRIDDVDEKLLALINKRAGFAAEVAEIKKKNGAGQSFYRPERETEILRRVIDSNPGPLSDEALVRIYRELMSACLALQQSLSIAYLGPEGTFTHAAVLKHFGHSVMSSAMSGIDQVFRKVESGVSQYGVVPIENSTEGVVNQTLDMLMTSSLKICGEIELRIHQHLLSNLDSVEQIERIYSHEQSLAQCRAWLSKNLSKAEQIAISSNAEAAKRASEDKQSAAIAGEVAAELYNLRFMEKNIEDKPDNTTRFLVLGKEDSPVTGDDKTSLLFSMPSKPGSLLKILACFADNNVNLNRIESRPSPQVIWEYIFIVDIDGHTQDPAVSKAIERLHKEAAMVKILGSYPRSVV